MATQAVQLTEEIQWNERPVGLCPPPDCRGVAVDDLRKLVQDFVQIKSIDDANPGLEFLDEHIVEPQEQQKFELWLRGLFPRPNNPQRFLDIANGLYDWASNR
jgi:hypothetical protein